MRKLEQWSKRSWSRGRSAHQEWVVDDVRNEAAAVSAVGIHRGSAYQTDGTIFAYEPTVTPLLVGQSYQVSIDWAPPEGGMSDDQQTAAEAIKKPPTVEFYFGEEEVPTDYDAEDYPLVNSALYPLTDTMPRKIRTHHWVIRRNEAFYNPTVASNFVNRVNGAITLWNGQSYDVGTLCLHEWRPVGEHELNPPWVRVEYHLEYNPLGFWVYRRDEGNYGWYIAPTPSGYGTTKKTAHFVHSQGKEIADPILLDGTGMPCRSEIKIHGGFAPAPASQILPQDRFIKHVVGGKTVSVTIKFAKFPKTNFAPLGIFT